MINDFEVELDLDDMLNTLADKAVSELSRTSPNNKGTYAKGWKKKKVNNGYIIYQSSKRASITHLLENGHLSKNLNWVKAQPHISKAEENMENNIEQLAGKIKIIVK